MKKIAGKFPGPGIGKLSAFDKIDGMQEKINSLRPFSPEMCEQLRQFPPIRRV
ncbi:MAG: hypothetical protein MUF15_09925 [Acidobacteria bacterium]|jgi:hypothetical protein|nr:hypothetical protein [Acidobacteriota bacterium]